MFPDILKTIILGIVQGVTEFLPISSTGHLILVNEFIEFANGPFKEMYDVVIQLGSIFAVLVYFHKKLFPLEALRNDALRKQTLSLWFKAAVGVFPALLIGGLFGSAIQRTLYNPTTVAVALILGGIALIWIESRHREPAISTMEQLSFRSALLIGLIQCLAMIPGTSRSASTILGGLLLGTSRTIAVEYSFFLAIPTMFAASAYSVLKHGAALSGSQWILLGIGFLVSFAVALFVVAFLMNFIKKYDFKPFGWYRIGLGALILVLIVCNVL